MTKPTTITIDLDWEGTLAAYHGTDPATGETIVEPVTFEDLVIERAAQIVAARAVHDETTAYKSIREKVREQIASLISEKVTATIEDELAKPRQPTNAYGEPKGEPTTLAEQVAAQVQTILKTPTRTSSYDQGKAVTPVERVVADLTGREVQKQVKAAVDGAKDEIVARVAASAAQVLTEGMKRTVQL